MGVMTVFQLDELLKVILFTSSIGCSLKTSSLQIFCLHGGLSPSLDTLDHIRALDRIQEVRILQIPSGWCFYNIEQVSRMLSLLFGFNRGLQATARLPAYLHLTISIF
jgi:hypothetical protein